VRNFRRNGLAPQATPAQEICNSIVFLGNSKNNRAMQRVSAAAFHTAARKPKLVCCNINGIEAALKILVQARAF
jgi:hypothetical protein